MLTDTSASTEHDEEEIEDDPSRAVDHFGLVGFVIEGKYRVDRVVAEGGFAVVYAGTHLRLEKPIAVKILKAIEGLAPKAQAEFVERFTAEARTLARLHHPSIVGVIDFGAVETHDGEVAPWMVLEWVSGNTLERDLRARRGRGGRRPSEALALLRPVIEALASAHDEGVAHRDLKPANVMVVHHRRGQTLKLLDFGIAKTMGAGEQAGTGATRTSSALQAFSPRYAAPEQFSNTRTGPWTDVHALGLMLSELLTDRPPYAGTTLAERLTQSMAFLRPTPGRVGVDVGPWEDVLTRAMALSPSDRYPQAGALLDALEESVEAADRARQSDPRSPPKAPREPASQRPEDTTLSGAAVSSQIPQPSTSRPTAAPPRAVVRAGEAATVGAPERRNPVLTVAVSAGLAAVLGLGLAARFRPRRGPEIAAPAQVTQPPVSPPSVQVQAAAIVAPAQTPTPRDADAGAEAEAEAAAVAAGDALAAALDAGGAENEVARGARRVHHRRHPR